MISSRHYYGVVSPNLFPLSRQSPRVFPECCRETEQSNGTEGEKERTELESSARDEEEFIQMDIEMLPRVCSVQFRLNGRSIVRETRQPLTRATAEAGGGGGGKLPA